MKWSSALALLLVLLGCAGPRIQDPIATYDFGPDWQTASHTAETSAPPAHAKLQASLMVAETAAPSWLDNTAIHYRLGYRNPAQSNAYAGSRWVAAPPMLLTQRIRSRIAGINSEGILNPADPVPATYMLRLELEEFGQVFDSISDSRGVIRMRASLIDRRARSLVAQRTFSVEQPAPSANAAGAVSALTKATDKLIENLIDWLSDELQG